MIELREAQVAHPTDRLGGPPRPRPILAADECLEHIVADLNKDLVLVSFRIKKLKCPVRAGG